MFFIRNFLAATIFCFVANGLGEKTDADAGMRMSHPGLADLFSRRRDAATFLAERRGSAQETNKERNKHTEQLKEECCEKGPCSWEERAEKSEKFPSDGKWDWVDKRLCEASLHERHQRSKKCRCKNRAKTSEYTCGIGKCSPCKGSFLCGSSFYDTGSKCVHNSKVCNSANECGNWKDENGCKFSQNLKITLSGSVGDYLGNVMIGGRPICDHGWDDIDAKIVCRKELKFGSRTKAISTKNGKFHKTSTDYIISNVQCSDISSSLYACSHLTRNVCPGGGVAGVICIDPETLTLTSKESREGNVLVGKYPVCGINWDKKDAQVVCNSLYRENFSERPNKRVPVFKAMGNSAFGSAPIDHFIMSNVRCNGDESWLSDCQADFFPIQCNVNQAAGVQCAKCTITDLNNIMNLVKENKPFSVTKDSVKKAFQKLKADCHPWDCSSPAQDYPEYCVVYQFLKTFEKMVSDNDRESGKQQQQQQKQQKKRMVSLKFNMYEQIQYLKDDAYANQIQSSIGDVMKQTADFQKDLGGYFKKLATYDKDRTVADFKLAKSIWNTQKEQIDELMKKFEPNFKKLFEVAFATGGATVADKAANLALAICSAIRPADAVLNGGEIAEVMKAINEALGALGDAITSMVSLGYTFSTTLPKFQEIATEISANFRTNAAMSIEMARILKIEDVEKFTVEDANSFLVLYEEFSPSITTFQLAQYTSLITEVTDNACEVITKEGSGAAAAAIRGVFHKLCPEIKRDRDSLIALVSAVKDSELDLNFNVYATLARSKLAITEAENFQIVQGETSLKNIRNAVAGKKAYVLYQYQKAKIINGACDLVKYRNYGIDESYCLELREDPNGDLSKLLSGLKGANAVMCQQPKEKIVNIPAQIRLGYDTIQEGTLDLSLLLDPEINNPSVDFQIPNTQWLVENGWLTSAESKRGPFYLKKFELFLPPWYGNNDKMVHTQLTLLKNTLEPNGEMYVFDQEVSYILQYSDHSQFCEEKNSGKDVYDIGCKSGPGNDLPKPCTQTSGVLNGQEIYPSLMSLWKVQMALPDGVRGQGVIPVSPTGKFNLRAKVAICFRQSIHEKREVEPMENHMDEVVKRYTSEPLENMINSVENLCTYLPIYKASKNPSSESTCDPCPSQSMRRLNGYYCESCPAGYEPRKKMTTENANWVFGCQPCKTKFFKATKGNDKCQPCASANEAGTTYC